MATPCRALHKLAGTPRLTSLSSTRLQRPGHRDLTIFRPSRAVVPHSPSSGLTGHLYRSRCNGSSKHISPITRQSWRTFSDDAAPQQPKKKPRRFRTAMRWIWRLTYLSALGGVAWLGYSIWLDRNPSPQVDPDPSKKTLVILGEITPPC